jgi:hypothetical protein
MTALKDRYTEVAMNRTGKSFIGFFVGGLCGALMGALIMGVPAYQDTSTGFLGPARDWAGLAALMGGFFGAIHGAIAGTIIGVVNAGKGVAALIGAATVLPGAAYLLSASGPHDQEVRAIAGFSLPAGALLGLLVSLILNRRRPKSEPPV